MMGEVGERRAKWGGNMLMRYALIVPRFGLYLPSIQVSSQKGSWLVPSGAMRGYDEGPREQNRGKQRGITLRVHDVSPSSPTTTTNSLHFAA